MFNYFLKIALDLGRLLAVMGFAWTSLQVVMGQKQMAGMLIGTATKWIFFFLIMSLYPGFTLGLRKLCTDIGNNASGMTVSFINKQLTEYITGIETLANSAKGQMVEFNFEQDEVFQRRKEELDQVYATQDVGMRNYDDDLMALKQERQKAYKKAQEENAKENAKYEKQYQGYVAKIVGIKSIMIVDEESQAERYKLDLSLRTSSGKDTGYISPNAVLKVVLLISEIMWEKEWFALNTEWAKAAGKKIDEMTGEPEKLGAWDITKFPVRKLINIFFVIICVIGMIIVSSSVLIQYIMAIIEYSITSGFAVLLVPCMLFDGLKDMSNKILPTLLSQAVKMMFIIICMLWTILSFVQIGKNACNSNAGFDLKLFAYVIFNLILIFSICSNAPKLAQTLLTGQPQMSMGEFVAAAGAVAGGAMAAKNGIQKGAAAAKNGIQKGVEGAANRIGDAAGMAGAAKKAFSEAKANGGGNLKSAIKGAGAALKTGANQTKQRVKEGAKNLATGKKAPSSLSYKGQNQQSGGKLKYGDYLKNRAKNG